MRKIEIDDEVYAYLQDKAIPYVENPNDTLRRLFGIKQKSEKELSIKDVFKPRHPKKPKTDLQELVQSGLLEEGQEVFLNYKEMKLSKKYVATVSGNRLLWDGKIHTMSGLVKFILRQEGEAIPSEAYRGPEYWYNSDHRSIKDLWEQYLKNN